MSKTYKTNTDFDKQISSFRFGDLYLYSYPPRTHGFNFIQHLISVNNSETKFVIYTKTPDFIKNKLQTYVDQTKTADFTSEYVEDNIDFKTELTLEDTVTEHTETIFIIHNYFTFEQDISISQLYQELSDQSNSVWVCVDNINDLSKKLQMYSDGIFTYKSQYNDGSYNQELHITKYYGGTNDLQKIDIIFKPEMTIDTTQYT